MFPSAESLPEVPSSVTTPAALRAEVVGDLIQASLLLARTRVVTVDYSQVCEVCNFAWSGSGSPKHSDKCLVGNIYKLVSAIGAIDSGAFDDGVDAPDRLIQYYRPAPPPPITHEAAARAHAANAPFLLAKDGE